MATIVGYDIGNNQRVWVNLDQITKVTAQQGGSMMIYLTDGSSITVTTTPDTISRHASGRP